METTLMSIIYQQYIQHKYFINYNNKYNIIIVTSEKWESLKWTSSIFNFSNIGQPNQ